MVQIVEPGCLLQQHSVEHGQALQMAHELQNCKADISEEGFDGGPETNKKCCCISGNNQGFHDRLCIHKQIGR